MKNLLHIITFQFFAVFLSLAAMPAFATDRACTPINMINTATQKPCGEGFAGLMFKRTVVTCPDGKVTQSADYDRSQCVPTTGNGGYVNPCIANPALCMGKPEVLGCPPGKHWTMEGLPYAHCVGDDPVCGWGESVRKNAIGEPLGCFPNTCPSNQVLQGDGISCACPAGMNWNGSMCVAPVVTCPADTNMYVSCPAGQTGTMIVTTSYYVSGGACAYTVTQDTSGCGAIVTPPTCPPTSVSYSACPAGQSGQIETTTTYSVVNNACQPSSSVTSNTCVVSGGPVTCPSDSVNYGSCPAGMTGQTMTVTTYSVVNNACQSSSYTDTSGCVPTSVVCPADSTSTSSCPAGQTGQITTTTSYAVVNGSCQSSTSVDTSNCAVSCTTSSYVEASSCDFGYSGTQTRLVTTNSCTGVVYGNWDKQACIKDPPTVFYEVVSGGCSTHSGNGFYCTIQMFCPAGFQYLSGGGGYIPSDDIRGSTYFISAFTSGGWEADFSDSITCVRYQ